MQEILGITDEPRQNLTFVLEDNSLLSITLEYRSNIRGWFYSLSSPDFTLNNKKLVSAPNILHKYSNVLKYGIAVYSTEGIDPAFVEDFIEQKIRIYVLNESDVENTREFYYGE